MRAEAVLGSTTLPAWRETGLEGGSPRQHVNVLVEPGCGESTTKRCAMLIRRLHAWSLRSDRLGVSEIWAGTLEVANTVLSSYGQACYDSGGSLHDHLETINAVVDGRRQWRKLTVLAWEVGKSWRRLVPVRCHTPVPLAVLLAMQTESIRRGWLLFAAALGLGFLGLLRPSEILNLHLEDVMTPSTLFGPPGRMFLRLGRTKTSHRSGAVHQRVRIDDSVFVPFMEAISKLPGAHPRHRLLRDGACAFRRRWDAVLHSLGIVQGRFEGLTPARLRAGGATHLFLCTQDIALVKWRGRWVSDRTLEHYLQEMGSASFITTLPEATRDRIASYAARTRQLLEAVSQAMLPWCDRVLPWPTDDVRDIT
jgi:hypothetical protein